MAPIPKPISRAEEKRDRAKQKLRDWQAVRRQVLERDGRRCRACNLRDGVDVHHLRFRSAGGGNQSNNLLCLCRVCHADVHAYRLAIMGDNANKVLRFVRRG